MNEHESEPIPGLPARLPPGEHILWQGAPEWRSLGRRAFHLAQIAVYFGLLLVWSTASAISAGSTPGEIGLATLQLLALGGGAMLLLAAFAWLTARTTVYTVTNRRLVMRFGVALPITFNLPFAQIEGAGLKRHADGSGDITLVLKPGQRLAYLVLWPHVRPWRLSRAEPMLRTIPDVDRVAQILGRALAAAADQPAPVQGGLAPAGSDRHAPATA